MMPLLISSGEPAGIGPDICLDLAGIPVVIIADKLVLSARAQLLKKNITIVDYVLGTKLLSAFDNNMLYVLHLPINSPVSPGVLQQQNSQYVLNMLEIAVKYCLQGYFTGLVTAPVHKGIINQAGFIFTGHTEFLTEQCAAQQVVMVLASATMKIAMVTTHVPLQEVASRITIESIINIVRQLHKSLQQDFIIKNPCIFVSGLNPHAGENGYLGLEEINIINPAIKQLQREDINVSGPYSADTLFSSKNLKICDVFLVMYHDQGLPVIKYASFGDTVNVTLGLPIVRTSVDHGTALELAGTGAANSSSLISAIRMANSIVKARNIGAYFVHNPNISLIAAVDKNYGIGLNNQLLCHLPADLQHFKQLTLGKTIIMGRKTFESIGKALPDRHNIVLSHQKSVIANVTVLSSLSAALQIIPPDNEIMVIGGADIYQQTLPLANTVYLTIIDFDFIADKFFPQLPSDVWHCIDTSPHAADALNNYAMNFCVFKRILSL